MPNENDKLKKLTSLLDVLDKDTVTSAEVEELVSILVTVVKESKVYNDKEVAKIQAICEGYVKQTVPASVDRMLAEVQKRLSEIKSGKDGTDGVDGLNGEDGLDGKDGKDGSPDSGDDIVNKINKVNTIFGPKIDASHIKNLPKSIETVVERSFSTGGWETPIKGGTNVTVTKNAQGAWVISSTGGSGSTAWGDIIGTLANQTDLQSALDGKADALGADDNYVTDAQLVVIGNTSGTNTGDQNLFSTIAVAGQSNVVADSTSDTLTLVAGSNITLTTNATSDTVTITGTGGGSGISEELAIAYAVAL